MNIVVVTGTGTGVGKTVVTAALAALARRRGKRVLAVKPAQTGIPIGVGPRGTGCDTPEPPDLEVIARLAGLDPRTDVLECGRYALPLAPAAAARLEGRAPVDLDEVADRIGEVEPDHDLVLVEGAGGLLVRFDDRGRTIADLAGLLGAPVLVVTAPSLGTLNHTALTLEAIAHRGLECAGLVIGRWPTVPGLDDRANISDLEALLAEPLVGAVEAGAGDLGPTMFASHAAHWLAPRFGGDFDAADFRQSWAPGTSEPRTASVGGTSA